MMTTKQMKSHAGTNGCRMMSCDHVDTTGRTWPKGTAYRPWSRGATPSGDIQTVIIESRHYQTVLTEGFGEAVEFAD